MSTTTTTLLSEILSHLGTKGITISDPKEVFLPILNEALLVYTNKFPIPYTIRIEADDCGNCDRFTLPETFQQIHHGVWTGATPFKPHYKIDKKLDGIPYHRWESLPPSSVAYAVVDCNNGRKQIIINHPIPCCKCGIVISYLGNHKRIDAITTDNLNSIIEIPDQHIPALIAYMVAQYVVREQYECSKCTVDINTNGTVTINNTLLTGIDRAADNAVKHWLTLWGQLKPTTQEPPIGIVQMLHGTRRDHYSPYM